MRFDVADGHVELGHSHRFSNFAASAGQVHLRLPARFVADLDVRPVDSRPPSRAEHLQHRLFRREASGEVLQFPFPAQAVLEFRRCENASEEPLTVPVHALAQTGAFHHVDTMSQDTHA